MRIRKTIWPVLALLLAVPLPRATLAADDAARAPLETVRTTVDAVIAILADKSMPAETKRRQVKAVVGQHFDYTAMAYRVLATNWKKADKRQRARFTALFRELLSNTYWRKISGYTNETVEYAGARLRTPKLATVNTRIKSDTVTIPVDYMLYRKDDGAWYAYDVVIEQVSLVRNYRGDFQNIVRDSGIDGLISDLKTRVAASSVDEPEPVVRRRQ